MDGNTVTELFPAFMLEDLANSGLDVADIRARLAGPGEKAATNTPLGLEAYVIPYIGLDNKMIPFYRVKIKDPPDPAEKYKQLATSSNHVYTPIGLNQLLMGNVPYILITEGEKKAAKAVKEGFPAIAFGGVDSWRNRTVTLHKDSQVGQNKKGEITVKLPPGAEAQEGADTIAIGFKDIITLAIRRNIPFIIVYDTDISERGLPYTKFEVQRAAASLGFELRNRGVPFTNIRQLMLKPDDLQLEPGDKLGLDDFLMHPDLGRDSLAQQLHDNLKLRSAFPKHPNTREWVHRKLSKSSLSREAMLNISTAIVCDLDTTGMRLHCPDDDEMYYFNEENHRLQKVHFTQHMEFAKTAFAKHLYEKYGLTQADQRLLNVLNSQFCGEQPISSVRPEKVMAIRGDVLYYQVSDGQMVKVSKDGIKILLNGADGILFEGGAVGSMDMAALKSGISKYSQMDELPNEWYTTLQEARIVESDQDRMRLMMSLLYSISPWLYRWRQTQLPLEQMLGEAGSGKSTLYKMRELILSGKSNLRNAPKDLKDWTASVANAGALHVTDNVHMTGGTLKQQLSDELCRVITEDEPKIEARKLYTDNELVQVPVNCTFAVTAIKQPFTNEDIIQRSIITQLDKGTGDIEFDPRWVENQLERIGGREYWVAYHLVFMHRLFQDIHIHWDKTYKAKFRLVNMEQLFVRAAVVYGMESEWIQKFLEGVRDQTVAKSDQAMEGLIAWADEIRSELPLPKLKSTYFNTVLMTAWFQNTEEYSENPVLTNPRSLASYLEQKKNTVAQVAGIEPTGFKKDNRKVYQVKASGTLGTVIAVG